MKMALAEWKALACTAVAVMLFAGPAPAQEKERVIIRKADADSAWTQGGRYTIEIEDGKVFINGEPAEGDHRVRILRKGPGEETVVIAGPHGAWVEGDGSQRRFMIEREIDGEGVGHDGPRRYRFQRFREGGPEMPPVEMMGKMPPGRWFGEAPPMMHFFGEHDGMAMQGHAEIATMELEARRLAAELKKAEGADRARMEQELRSRLREILDRKMTLREEHVARMQEEIALERKALDERRSRRDEIIERRLRELTGARDVLEW